MNKIKISGYTLAVIIMMSAFISGSFVYFDMEEQLFECKEHLDARPFKCLIREEVDNRYIFDERGWVKIDSLRSPIKEILCEDLE